MKTFLVCFVIAITLNASLGMSFRHKRQSSDVDDEDNLDDRYGWNRPNQGNRPGRNQFPGSNGNQFPGFNQGGNQFPGFNQGGNQFPGFNQGGNQFPGSNQGGNQFPGSNQGGNQFPGSNNGNQPQPTPAPTGNGSTTQSSAVQECIRNCPVTPEYNPVCGTNMVQYTNPGRLGCAQACGVNVSLLRASACPTTTTTQAPTS